MAGPPFGDSQRWANGSLLLSDWWVGVPMAILLPFDWWLVFPWQPQLTAESAVDRHSTSVGELFLLLHQVPCLNMGDEALEPIWIQIGYFTGL
jgi:hypothetical protein